MSNNNLKNDLILDISENNLTLDISENDLTLDISENDLTLDISKNTLVDLKIKDIIKCLCFSGGGIKGLSFIGALQKLIEDDLINMNNIELFCGTSAGSMIAFLLNIGLSVYEMKDFILAFNFSKLNGEINCIDVFDKDKLGINNGERIKLIFIKFLEKKYNKSDITFKELFELTNKKLIIIGTNITNSEETIFNIDLTPNFSVLTAIRISISIPGIFTPVKIDNIIYVDGAIVNNFPINHCLDYKTIGFYIKNSQKNEINSIQDLITSCLSIACNVISEKTINDINKINPNECWNKYKKLIIKIDNPNFEYTNFDISYEYKNNLIELGTKTIETFINNLDQKQIILDSNQ